MNAEAVDGFDVVWHDVHKVDGCGWRLSPGGLVPESVFQSFYVLAND